MDSAEIQSNGFDGFPPVPTESRLTVEGALVGRLFFLERQAYVDLIEYFGNEAPKELHPFPTTPGINAEEIDICTGLRTWSDRAGEGWLATSTGKPTKSNKFSLQEWGSWRLAFLLAWLQRAVWCYEGAELAEEPANELLPQLQDSPQARKRGRPPLKPVPSPTSPSEPERRQRGRPQRQEVDAQASPKRAKPASAVHASPGRGRKLGRPRKVEEIEDAEEHMSDASEPDDGRQQEHGAIVIDFPADPEDSRFTVEGAELHDNGKIKVSAYRDEELMEIFRDEPPLRQHPDPARPGLRQSELRDPRLHEIQSGLKSLALITQALYFVPAKAPL
jgi:hypothetical protein